jgi:hypothetical protein
VAQSLHRVRELIGADLEQQVEEISREMNQQVDTVVKATLAGDNRRLRGLPAVGRGVSGHIPGTDPLEALLDKYDEEDAA